MFECITFPNALPNQLFIKELKLNKLILHILPRNPEELPVGRVEGGAEEGETG